MSDQMDQRPTDTGILSRTVSELS